jgi:hypothetical protein
MYRLFFVIIIAVFSCKAAVELQAPLRRSTVTGDSLYKAVVSMGWKSRDSVILEQAMAGDIPPFLMKLVPVHVFIIDSISHKRIDATYFVTPDYFSLGTSDNWCRVPMTPMAAQRIADTLHCFLPTRKMVDDIYRAAKIKLEPVPMYAFRDSSITMWQHHLIIEGQRKGRGGLIAGIKKDLVISDAVSHNAKADREAIYGWHRLNGKAIQPLYTGHINWWVDYSHGIRLVFDKIRIDGKWVHYTQILADPVLRKLLCDEAYCDFYRYVY